MQNKSSKWIEDYFSLVSELMIKEKENLKKINPIETEPVSYDKISEHKYQPNEYHNDWMLSKSYIRDKDESDLEFWNRNDRLLAEYNNIKKARGLPIITERNELIDINYSKEIKMEKVKETAQQRENYFYHSDFGKQWICPYCARNGRGFFMKVINPTYPEGFIDLGGVFAKCLCVRLRSESLKQNKETKRTREEFRLI